MGVHLSQLTMLPWLGAAATADGLIPETIHNDRIILKEKGIFQ